MIAKATGRHPRAFLVPAMNPEHRAGRLQSSRYAYAFVGASVFDWAQFASPVEIRHPPSDACHVASCYVCRAPGRRPHAAQEQGFLRGHHVMTREIAVGACMR